jgi:integrase
VIGPPKSKRSRRVVSVPAFAVEALRRHQRRQHARQVELGHAWHHSDFVFTSPIGTALDPANLRKAFSRLLADPGLPHLRLHDLRHVAATLMLSAGADVRTVMEVLGHSQIGITLDLYAHVLPHKKADAAQRVDHLLRPASLSDDGEAAISGQDGGQTPITVAAEVKELPDFPKELVVSPEGIEPSTYRLRVCCSAN